MSPTSGFATLEDATATKGSLHHLITEPDRALSQAARLNRRRRAADGQARCDLMCTQMESYFSTTPRKPNPSD